jgi:hypothetical protein
MFDPIKGPANQYQAPATGLGTEAGDTWHEAVRKINAGFKNVIKAISGGVESEMEMIDSHARDEIADLREELAAMQIRFDRLPGSSTADPLIDKPTRDPSVDESNKAAPALLNTETKAADTDPVKEAPPATPPSQHSLDTAAATQDNTETSMHVGS